MTDNQILKKVIAAIKFKFNLKQAEIASKMGVNNSYFSSVINGKEILSELFLDKLSSAFFVSREYLGTGEGNIFLDESSENKGTDIVSMSREVFELLKRQSETILSQQRTIEMMQEEHKKMLARMDNVAISAVAGK